MAHPLSLSFYTLYGIVRLHSLAGEGVGGPKLYDSTETLDTLYLILTLRIGVQVFVVQAVNNR
jgi:hypothetical protein